MRKKYLFTTVLLLLMVFQLLGTPAFVMDNIKSAKADNKNTGPEKSPDEIIVKFKGVEEIRVIKIAETDNFKEILESYNYNNLVEYAEPNYLYKAAIIPSDTYYKNQWYLKKINAEDAWNIINESPKVIIAIIDSGIQIAHPDLKDNIWINKGEIAGNKIDDDKNGFIDDANGWDFINNIPDPSPKFDPGFTEAGVQHGTIVAGIAAASGNNAAGIAGVSWKSQIMPLRVLDDTGQGNTSNVIKAVDYAIANGAHIINFSFVGFGYSKSLESAIRRAYDAGIIVVAAAGNEQGGGDGYSLDKLPLYPVCHDGSIKENMVIGVAATDAIDQKASFSSFGTNCVDISAPGISIFSTVVHDPKQSFGENKPFDKYYDGYWSGTSMATPMVSGAFALVIQQNPQLKRSEVVNIILNNAIDINKLNPNHVNELGRGRLDVLQAVENSKVNLSSIATKIISAPFLNYKSIIKITDFDGRLDQEFFAYGTKFIGGVNIATGDVDGDGISEIITGAGQGGGPHVRIFDNKGNLKGQFFAYAASFRGGVNVATGDVNGDGISEIITGAGQGGGPHVRIFDNKGNLKGQFFAYAEFFRGGVNVATGDVDRDGKNEIITGPGVGAEPYVKIFKGNGEFDKQILVFDKKFRAGVKVAVTNENGGIRGGRGEIVVSPGKGGGPQVRVFDYLGNVLAQFFAYNLSFRGGVNIATADINNDGEAEIITGAGPSGSPHIRVFTRAGVLLNSFFGYEETFVGGVNVGILK